MRIVVLPGDGIGPGSTAATLNVLRAASERFQGRGNRVGGGTLANPR
jgi:hypothetical protein